MQPEAEGLFNISYSEKEINEEIQALVGKPFKLIPLFKMGGSGSPRMIISDASELILPWMNTDKYIQYCNMELRPGGIIVRFRSRLDSLAFVVSYSDLKFERERGKYRISNGKNFLILAPFKNPRNVASFFKKMERFSIHPPL